MGLQVLKHLGRSASGHASWLWKVQKMCGCSDADIEAMLEERLLHAREFWFGLGVDQRHKEKTPTRKGQLLGLLMRDRSHRTSI